MSTVTAAIGDGTKVSLSARQFDWVGDEPPAAGGTDTGPTPYEMLLGGLVSCIALTLRLYANHKRIALEGVDVEAEFDRIHARDCEDCDERTDGWIDRIQTRVTLRGTFDDAQKKRLAQVASRCPVHKTLANGVHLVDRVEFNPLAAERLGKSLRPT